MPEILEFARIIVGGLGMTLGITLISIVIGAILAIPLTIARMSHQVIVRNVAKYIILFVRGVPTIVWVFLIFFGLGQMGLEFDQFSAAIVAFSVIAAGYLAEVYRSGYLSINDGQFEAARALGLSRVRSLLHVTLPQAVAVITPGFVTFLIGHFKDTAIASVIGAQEMTERAMYLSRREEDILLVFLVAGAIYLAISIPVGVFGRWLEPKMALAVGVAK